MKVMQRGIMKVLPGKMMEIMELNKKYMAIVNRLMGEMPTMRMYRPFTGGGDYMHTIIFEREWDSLTTMTTFFEKVMKDPEVQAQMLEWEVLLNSHEIELYIAME